LQKEVLNSSSSHPGRPRLRLQGAERPAGFNYTCTSRYLDIGELRLHAVIGADRPPLLVHV
jgi:hypothetical protein